MKEIDNFENKEQVQYSLNIIGVLVAVSVSSLFVVITLLNQIPEPTEHSLYTRNIIKSDNNDLTKFKEKRIIEEIPKNENVKNNIIPIKELKKKNIFSRELESLNEQKNERIFSSTKLFVWELCCSANENKNDTIILKLNDDDDSLTSVLIIHDKKSSMLLFKKIDSSKKNDTIFKEINLKNKQKFISFHINKNGFLNIYIDCNFQSNKEDLNKNLTINLNEILTIKSFDYNENVYVYDDLTELTKVFKCPKTTITVLDGSILYFYDNFELNNHGNNIISFKHDSKFYSICYKNRQIEISSNNLNTSIKIQLNPKYNFAFGLYLYFKCSSIEIYDSCPSKANSLVNNFVGVWNTSIFAENIFIKTYRNYISSNGATLNTLEMFCNNANLYSQSKKNDQTCSILKKNILEYDETNKIMNKYMPPMFTKYLTLNYHEGSIYLKNNPIILVASRYNSKVSFFNRSLTEYEEGFTDGQYNFWLGLDALHKLTYANKFRLKIVVSSKSNTKIVEEYSFLKVENSKNNYTLLLGKIKTGKGYFANYNNTQFSTYDFGNFNLAKKYLSGFWHKENTTLCFDCVDDISESIGSAKLRLNNGKIFQIFNSKMYLVVS